MSTVRFPSRRSSPAGLPVTAGSPKTPSRSSRSWNASPSGSPYAEKASNAAGRPSPERGAEVQRALDGVLRRLVAGHPEGPLDRPTAARLLDDVQVLARHQLDPHGVADRVRAAQRGVVEPTALRSSLPTTRGTGRRAGSRSPRRNRPMRRPTPARRARRRTARAPRACPAAWRFGRSRHRGPARRPAAARDWPPPGSARRCRARRPPARPSSRRRGAAVCHCPGRSAAPSRSADAAQR